MMICETWEIQMLTSMSPENLSIGHQVLAAEKALGKGKHLGDGRLGEPREMELVLRNQLGGWNWKSHGVVVGDGHGTFSG